MNDVESSSRKTSEYNNSNPLLTGDLLFQQRIDRAIVQFNASLVDTGEITGRLGAVESLYLDMVYFLSDDEIKKVDQLIEDCQKYFSVICQFRNKVHRSESYKNCMNNFLGSSKEAMVILIKKSFEKGHIVKIGGNSQNGRR